MVCANADSTIVNDVPTTPTKESIQKTVADLNAINASATAEGKAALEPLIAAFTSIENVNFSASTPPPEYQAFITASQKFKSTCENAGVSFTAKPSSSPS